MVLPIMRGYSTSNAGTAALRENSFQAMRSFFALPYERKQQRFCPLHEEQGYRHLGFKESYVYCGGPLPSELRPVLPLVQRLHQVALSHLSQIEQQLQLQASALTQLAEREWSEETRCTSVLRLLKYDPQQQQLPCDPHEDLGLLSIVLKSTSPALEVLDTSSFAWSNVEHGLSDSEVIFLVGASLARLTQTGTPGASKLDACVHRVVDGSQNASTLRPHFIMVSLALLVGGLAIAFFATAALGVLLIIAGGATWMFTRHPGVEPRYSIVYQLRIRDDAQVNSRDFTTPILPQLVAFELSGRDFLAQLREGRASVNGTY